MKPIKFKSVDMHAPKWGHDESRTTTNNKDWKQGAFIVFEDYEGNEYEFMPKWADLMKMNNIAILTEQTNKQLAVENYYNQMKGGTKT